MKKNILIWMPFMLNGGIETVLANVLNYIDYDKHEVTVLLTSKTGNTLGKINPKVRLEYLAIGNEFLSSNPFLNKIQKLIRRAKFEFLINNIWFIHKFILKEKYDTEVAFVIDTVPYVYKSPNKNSKKIAWIHNNLKLTNGEVNKHHLRNYDLIVNVSKRTKEQTIHVDSTLKNKSIVIYNPVDINSIFNRANESKIDFKTKIPIFIGMGRLTNMKAFDVFIKAHHLLKKNGFISKVKIIGEGYLRPNLESLIKELDLEDSVELLGYNKNPMPYLIAADYFVLSSISSEAYPMALTEALVLGKPVIATDIGGVSEMFKDIQNGYLVEPNPESLYLGMKKILTNNIQTEQMKKNNKIFKTQLDPKKVIAQIEAVL